MADVQGNAPATNDATPRVGFADRVAAKAVEVRVLRLLLTLLALPFYVLGVVVAFVWLAVKWCCAAVAVGFADVKAKRGDAAG